VLGVLAPIVLASAADAADTFPDPRPQTTPEAASFLAHRDAVVRDLACGLPRVVALSGQGLARSGGPLDRALSLVAERVPFPAEQIWTAPGIAIRYTAEDAAQDRAEPADADANGVPDVVQAAGRGLSEARALLVEDMGLPAPERFDAGLRELGDDVDAVVFVNERRSPPWTVIDATPCAGVQGARDAAVHAYARAVAFELGPGFPRAWAEAFATWARLEIDGTPDSSLAQLLTERLHRLDAGLFSRDPRLAAGNAAWLAWVDEALGRPALVASIRELTQGDPAAAFGRALARTADVDLAGAFRDFQVWSLLTGARADLHHFPFAAALGSPRFASESDGLPALSIHADPPLAAWGATAVRLVPDRTEGGMSVHFEGDLGARWQVDLVLAGEDGRLRRLALDVADAGRGQATVPVDGLSEAILLVRHVGSADETPRRYNYSAHHEAGHPFEIAVLEAREAGEPAGGILVSWETASEHGVIGWDVLRVREDGGREVVVNPVWVPAVGEESSPASYHYLDASALPGVSYLYRVRATTAIGLASATDRILVRRTDRPTR
jgi:hypothetical protein